MFSNTQIQCGMALWSYWSEMPRIASLTRIVAAPAFIGMITRGGIACRGTPNAMTGTETSSRGVQQVQKGLDTISASCTSTVVDFSVLAVFCQTILKMFRTNTEHIES